MNRNDYDDDPLGFKDQKKGICNGCGCHSDELVRCPVALDWICPDCFHGRHQRGSA